MKSLLVSIVAAVLLVGCATTQQPEPPTALGDILSGALGGEYNMGRPLDEEERRLVEELRAQGVYVPQERKVSPFRYGAGTVSKRNLQDIRDAIKPEQERRMKELMWQRNEAARKAAAVEKFNQDKAPDISIRDAAREGNTEAVKQHLAAGTDVDAKDVLMGMTPLHYAAIRGQKEIVELLIAKGADVNAIVDSLSETSLDWAIMRNHTETAELLRKHGGKTGKELKGGEPVAEAATSEPSTAKTPNISIYKAAAEGNIEAVKQHIAAGTGRNIESIARGLSALHSAAFGGQKEVVELLIEKGADVNAKNDVGWTPLHNAAFSRYTRKRRFTVKGYKEIAELLISAGADVNAKDKNGKTPLDVAINAEVAEKETADLLRKHGGKTGEELSIHLAAREGNTEAVKQHLAAGADVNATDEVGWTPLHRAVGPSHKEVVELLIAEGADVNTKGKYGNTPLDTAIRFKRTETADLLRKHGGKTAEELKAEGK